MMLDGNLKELNSSWQSGVGVRVLYKGAWGFSASSEVGNLGHVFDRALDNARVAAERVTFPVRLAEKDAIIAEFHSPNRIDPFTVALDEKVALLKRLDEKLNQTGVARRMSWMDFTRKPVSYT